ncbi:MAG: sigma 54-interacting transcriptional regulator [Candidatus Eisenbacteria bacterium]
METSCTRDTETSLESLLGKLLARTSGSLSNVLIVGKDRRLREAVAHAFHDARSYGDGTFSSLNCRGELESLRSAFVALFTALTRGRDSTPARLSGVTFGGTLFIDEIEWMDIESQKTCLDFLKELQRQRNESPRSMRLRVVAGTSCNLYEAAARGRFLPGLLDLLDKVRVELDREGPRLSAKRYACSRLTGESDVNLSQAQLRPTKQ